VKALEQLSHGGKSPGENMIHIKLLTKGEYYLIGPLTSFFNRVWNSEELP